MHIYDGEAHITCDNPACDRGRFFHPWNDGRRVVRVAAEQHGWARRREYQGPGEYPKRLQQWRMVDLCPECAKEGDG